MSAGGAPLVKICGVKTAEAARWTVAAGADLIGFVFFEKSPRAIAPEAVAAVSDAAGDLVRVGLFVDADDALIDRSVEAGRLDWAQLHGRETPERAAEIAEKFEIKVMKALGVSSEEDVAAAEVYRGAAARLMFDAKPPQGADRPGGHGAAFDWSLLAAAPEGLPWLLAGGLTPENVAAAVGAVRTAPGFLGVDVSSGVESASGVKDEMRIKAFVRAARGF